MTANRDFDDIARAWLDLMPDEAPDRLIADVLTAVEAAPQVRSPWRWRPWRSTPMNRLAFVLGAAAVVAVAGTLLLFRSGPPPSVGSSPSPVASIGSTASAAAPSPSGSSAAVPLPSELLGRWMGGHRSLVAANAGTSILFGPSNMAFSQSNTNNAIMLLARASSVAAGRIQLSSNPVAGGCTVGDTGTYSSTRSPSGRSLTITAERDDCAARADAVAGTWSLMGCQDPTDDCLGLLDAGTYQSQFITPRLKSGATWVADYGAVSYQVPDGWANDADWPQSYDLVPASVFPPGPNGTGSELEVLTQPTAMAQDTPCSDTPAPSVGRTVRSLVAWLRTVPGLVTTAPKGLTIDGHPAQSIDLRIDPAWKGTCSGETGPFIAYLNPDGAIARTEHERLILVDLGGDVVAIKLRTSDPAAFDAFVAKAMPIVASLHFR